MRAGETLRFYISNVSRWMERITITQTIKCMFCGVPPSDLSRNVDIKHRGVLTWISDSSSGKNRSVFRTYVAKNDIVCWCYLTPFMFIRSVAYRYVYSNPYREAYTNIYRVIGIILLAIPLKFIGRAIIEKLSTIRRQSAYFWSVGGRQRVMNIVMLIYTHDMRSGLQ